MFFGVLTVVYVVSGFFERGRTVSFDERMIVLIFSPQRTGDAEITQRDQDSKLK